MKIGSVNRLALLIVLLICVFCLTARAENKEIQCVMGYSTMTMVEIDAKDADAALKIWAQDMGRKYGFKVETTLYKSVDMLVKDFTANKLDFIGMSSIDYMRLAPVLKVKPEMTRYKGNKATTKYLLVTNTNHQKMDLASLKNKKLATLKTNHLGMLFLNTELLKARQPEADRFFSMIQEKGKESQAILAVFFGQADASLVSEDGFNTMVELNPQIGRKLHIVRSSPELIEVVSFFRKDYLPAYKEQAIRGLQGAIKQHERGKQIMLLFNVDRMDFLKEGQLDSVTELLSEYTRLKGRGK